MPFQIICQDITKCECGAIVNAANSTLLGGGGVDGAIHRAAGPKLLKKCRTLGGCKTGEAKITKGYNLNCKYIIHTVGPVWGGGVYGEEEKLRDCYRNSLLLAKRHRVDSVAFPLISSGAYGYPRAEALRVATDEITRFLKENDMTVFLVIYDKSAYAPNPERSAAVRKYIENNYIGNFETYSPPYSYQQRMSGSAPGAAMPAACKSVPVFDYAPQSAEIENLINNRDESFTEMLLRKIDEKGIKDSECYKKANIDRKLFSKIRSNSNYKPSKPTVIAFAVALELGLDETRDMLKKAGYALSNSDKFDIIIEYFIKNGNYNVYEINEVLFEFDQKLLA